MAIHSVSQSVTGCPMPFGSIVQSYSPARERWAYCYYKAVTEWKKDDDYTDALCSSDRVMRKRTEKLREGLCFWDDAKNAGAPHFPESDENWYFHPQRFIDHLNKVITPAEFNPYEGKTYNSIYVDSSIPKGVDMSTEVEDNPGFAPKANNTTKYEYNGQFYTGVNGLFNEDYSQYYGGKTHWHTGVDFPAGDRSEIQSFIHGKVWACTWSGTVDPNLVFENKSGFGNMMIIKGLDDNQDKLYILAHLSGYELEMGEECYPGQTVAYVGNTGKSSGPHLHLEVRKCTEENPKLILDKTANIRYSDSITKNEGKDGLKWMQNKNPPKYDPFNHGIPLK